MTVFDVAPESVRRTGARSLIVLWVATVVALTAAMSVQPAPARAADITDVVDAADGDDPFDLHLEPRFTSTLKRAKITREAPCNPEAIDEPTADQASDPRSRTRFPRLVESSRCVEPSVVSNKELRAWEETSQLDILAQIGLFRDVEFHLELPIIFVNQRGAAFAGNGGDRTVAIVDATNSSVDPSDARIIDDIRLNEDLSVNGAEFTTFRLFDVQGEGNKGPERSGFGDMKIGLAWNPFNDERDDTKATLKIGFDYLIPSGEVAKGGNTGVGRGVHELQWTFASSKRFKYMDPYFQVQYVLPLAAGSSLFQKEGAGQTLQQPGQRAEIQFGSEFIPFEDKEKGHKFQIDLGLSFGYTAEGRDYSLLFDAFANSSCNGLTPNEIRDAIARIKANNAEDRETVSKAACAWILDGPANADGAAIFDTFDQSASEIPFSHDGITDYEAFGTFGAHLGFYVQAARYVQFRGKLRLQHQQEHFITAARTGVDSASDENDTVRFDNPEERNPFYNTTLDGVGNRFRVEETTIFTWSVALALQF